MQQYNVTLQRFKGVSQVKYSTTWWYIPLLPSDRHNIHECKSNILLCHCYYSVRNRAISDMVRKSGIAEMLDGQTSYQVQMNTDYSKVTGLIPLK